MNNKNFDLLNLYRLQLSDNKISFLEKEIEKLKSSEELKAREEELNESIATINNLSASYNELEKERKRLDDELSMRNEKIKKNEQKLSSGTLTSTREIVSYQEEIASIKKLNEDIENKIIEIMIKIDDINELIKSENDKKEKGMLAIKKLQTVSLHPKFISLYAQREGKHQKPGIVISINDAQDKDIAYFLEDLEEVYKRQRK